MKIFFWPADRGGCAWYRCEIPATALSACGHTTMSATVMPDQWRDEADVIVGQRVCNPGPTQRWQELARQQRVKLIYELDDNLLDTSQTNAQVHEFFSRPEIRANIIRCLVLSHAVTVSSEALADVVRRINPNVHVIPNFVPGWLLELPAPQQRELVTVGWAGGPTHSLDWAEAATDVARFIERSQAELHLIGPPALHREHQSPEDQRAPKDLTHRLPANRLRITPWLDSVPNYYRAVDFHIGLAPLRATVFNRSKSHIKGLEYAALGIPCVASDVGPYSQFVDHGTTGYLVKRPHEWGRRLRELLSPALRQEMGTAARALAKHHTIENNIQLWEEALTC